jgi:ribokinase
VPSVLVFGSVHIDHLLRVPRFPLPGETLSGESGGRQLGGKAVNQALAASKTVPTWLVAAIGHDRAGQQASERLEADGVAAYLEVIPELPTGESVALLEPDGENRAVILPGANHGLTAQMVIRQIERFQPSLVVTQLESHPETTDKVLDHCGKQRIPVLLNAAPYRTLAPIQIAQLEYLVVNQLEAQQLFGLEVSDHGLPDLEVLPGVSAKHTLVTLGAAGVLHFEAGQRTNYVPAPQVNVITSHGAGDVFVGTFAAQLVQGQPIHTALEQATIAASRHVETGASTSMHLESDRPHRR